MGKKNVSSEVDNAEQSKKVVTKYDKKMQKRKEEAAKAARSKKITMVTLIVIVVAALTAGILAVWTNYDRVHHKYIAVDNEPISQIEFDFYYTLSKQGIMSQTLYGTMTYQSYFESYLGYDSSKSDASQSYTSYGSTTSDYTWYDYFANSAVSTIKEYKALNKAADEEGFDYTTGDDDYNTFSENIASAAESAGVSVAQYYKNTFGSHATESNVKPYMMEYLKAAAYQEQKQTDLTPTADEITAYYNENKDNYDTVNYRSFIIAAEDSTETSMATAKSKAEAMAAGITDETTFAAQCVTYATDDQKDAYSTESTSLTTGASKSTLDAAISDWLFDSTRTAGNLTVIEDTENSQYYVVYFVSRDYDSSNDTTISSTLISEKYETFITGYTDAMTVENTKNRIKMLEE